MINTQFYVTSQCEKTYNQAGLAKNLSYTTAELHLIFSIFARVQTDGLYFKAQGYIYINIINVQGHL